MRRLCLAVLILLVSVWAAPPAQAAPIIIDLFTSAPPAVIGGYTMTAFPADPQGSPVTSVASPLGGLVGFGAPVDHLLVGGGWATWSHGYTGDVYYTGGALSLTMTMPADTVAFYFYAEPRLFASFEFIVSSGGVSSAATVEGRAGAYGWGIYDAAGLTSISITSNGDFAVGEFGIAKKDGGAVPDPGSSLLLLGLGLAGLAWRKRV
jgi:hypothetical protein